MVPKRGNAAFDASFSLQEGHKQILQGTFFFFGENHAIPATTLLEDVISGYYIGYQAVVINLVRFEGCNNSCKEPFYEILFNLVDPQSCCKLWV